MRIAAQPLSVAIVEYHDMSISGQAKIAFDPRAHRNRGLERCDAVLRDFEPRVKAAVSEALKTRIERVSP